MRVAALTQGLNIPSARFRIRQLIPPLANKGIQIDELTGDPGAYPPPSSASRLIWAGAAFANAAKRVKHSLQYEACIVQRELISTLPSLERFSRRPMIADIDDAIWLYRRGWAANNLARAAQHIVVGNDYLAKYFERFDRPMTVIPTAVDASRFVPMPRSPDGPRIIGWSGTWGGYRYFEPLQDALTGLLRKHPDWRLRFVSDRPPTLTRLPVDQVEYLPWKPETEAQLTADMDIGLMPLDSSPWSLGKCSYKMLLYMACGVPVVASNLGMNREILSMRHVGIGANTPSEWSGALEQLMLDDARRAAMGSEGRQLVLERFSLEVISLQWQAVLHNLDARGPI